MALTPRKPNPTGVERMHLRADGMAKIPFTKAEAKRAVKLRTQHGGRPPAVYRCPSCDAWHLATVRR